MSNKKYIIIVLIMIFICSFLSYWRFKQFSQSLTEVELPEIEMPEIELEKLLYPEKEGYQEWISPDGKLKLKYSAEWTEIDKTFLNQSNQEALGLKDAEILLYAYRVRLQEQTLAFLMVEKISAEKSLEEIIAEMEKGVVEQEGEMEIVSLENKNETTWLEVRLKKKGELDFYSKEKIIFGEDKTYFIAFTTLERDWQKFEEEVKEIFDSIQFTF